MARNNVPFEIGAKVAELDYKKDEYGQFVRDSSDRSITEYPDKGLIIAGYTYWGTGLSVLTVDLDGNEKEHMHGCGLKLC